MAKLKQEERGYDEYDIVILYHVHVGGRNGMTSTSKCWAERTYLRMMSITSTCIYIV